jgi:lysozyme-like protein/LysM domain-containing protein
MLPFATQPPEPPAIHSYEIHSGDTLWGIAKEVYGNPLKWPNLFGANRDLIANPNLILPGWTIRIPSNENIYPETYAPKHSAGYVPKHAATISDPVNGTLECPALENLWDSQGGNPDKAFIAAEVAMAESSGNQYATGPYGEEGYWQINPSNNGLVVNGLVIEATYDPAGNAKDAIALSSDGTNWSDWTTYDTGAEIGEC